MKRDKYLGYITRFFRSHNCVAILGPRQCGKTTLAKMYAKNFAHKNVTHFDLENPVHLAQLENPKFILEDIKDLIIIDEIQRRPDLFPVLRVLLDQNKPERRFLILGSASRELIKQSSETLAGRIAYLELTPFNFNETNNLQNLWVRGGYPRSYLASNIEESIDWRTFYIRNFLENDIRHLGFDISSGLMHKFWLMLAHYHSQIFNASEIATSLGIAHTTAKKYLDILAGTFMIRTLNPWFENIKKRQVKTPKIYFRDSGIWNSLIGLTDYESIRNHPKLGASWEGIALEEIIRCENARPEECYFWRTQHNAEIDLLIVSPGMKKGFEFKFSDAPKLTKSMQTAYSELKLDNLTVIFPGKEQYKIANGIEVIGLEKYIRNYNLNFS